jgi:hypothetical protein
MIKKNLLIIFLFTQHFSLIYASVYFVAPAGKDINSGSISMPFATIQKAQEAVKPGDTVYIRGGVYQMQEEQIARKEKIWAYVTYLDKSGVQGKPINYFAYHGEKPVFDYTDIKPAGLRIIAFYVSGSWIHFQGLEITGIQVTIKTHTQSECFENHGSNNIYELLNMHDGMAIGIYLLDGSNNLFLNCDAYRNYDYFSETGRGGNTDGFGCHPSKGSTGNIFRGCRAWFNSDDGYDVINSHESVTFENCWSFYNGYSPDFKSLGDGNGFKMGGYGNRKADELPNPIPRNIISHCIAVRNKANGFYSNHHINGSIWNGNIAYKNSVNYNMLNRLKDNITDVPGYYHQLYYNIGYKGGREIQNIDTAYCKLLYNFFDTQHILTDADFVSTDETLLTASRKKDGSLPDNGFLKPASKWLVNMVSSLIEPSERGDPNKTKIVTDSLHGLKYEIKKLIFSDEFEKLDSNSWITEMETAPGSSIYTKNNSLILDTRKGVTVWLNKFLTGNIEIEFDRAVIVDNGKNDRLSDMNMFWMATDAQNKKPFGRNGIFESYDSLNLYYAGIGGNTNKTTRFRRYQSDGYKGVLKEYKDSAHLLTKNNFYHITITIKNNFTALWIDDECYFDFGFAKPLNAGYFAFRSTWSRQQIKNFRVFQLL